MIKDIEKALPAELPARVVVFECYGYTPFCAAWIFLKILPFPCTVLCSGAGAVLQYTDVDHITGQNNLQTYGSRTARAADPRETGQCKRYR